MMTRPDFEAIAKVIDAEISVRRDSAPGCLAIKQLTYSLADVFARNNPRFNRAMFYAACGLDSE